MIRVTVRKPSSFPGVMVLLFFLVALAFVFVFVEMTNAWTEVSAPRRQRMRAAAFHEAKGDSNNSGSVGEERNTSTHSLLEQLLRDGLLLKNSSTDGGEVELTNDALTSGRIYLKPEQPLKPVPADCVKMLDRDPHSCLAQPLPPAFKVVFCAIVRNRAKLVVEWIQWHRILGVSHFHLYDDGSTDFLEQHLRPFIAEGVVTLDIVDLLPPYQAFGHEVQGPLLPVLEECIKEESSNHGQVSWVGLVDPDEFVLLPGGVCIPQYLERVVQRGVVDAQLPSKSTATVGAVAAPWMMVGHRREWVDTFPSQFDRTAFSAGQAPVHLTVFKVFVRADLPVDMKTGHLAQLRSPYVTVWPDGSVVRPDVSRGDGIAFFDVSPFTFLIGERALKNLPPNATIPIRLLHYKSRSFVSGIQRMLDGFADMAGSVNVIDVEDVYLQWLGDEIRGPMASTKIPASYLVHRYDLLRRSLDVARPVG